MQKDAIPYSPACINFIKQWQGLSLERYKDAQGRWLIGYGHEITRNDGIWDMITAEQAEAYLLADLQACKTKLNTQQDKFNDRFQLEALLILIFSYGVDRFLRTGRLPSIADAIISQPDNA
ncbi:TPA: hypothetical protein ACIPUI_001804 [Citrobacter freundii]